MVREYNFGVFTYTNDWIRHTASVVDYGETNLHAVYKQSSDAFYLFKTTTNAPHELKIYKYTGDSLRDGPRMFTYEAKWSDFGHFAGGRTDIWHDEASNSERWITCAS